MTSREVTSLRRLPQPNERVAESFRDKFCRFAFGAITWPWLLKSLWGGTKSSKIRLLERLGLPEDALPNLGSWKADTRFLHLIVDAIEELKPRSVVELGAGASTLVCAKALQLNGGGKLSSFDQHAPFVGATKQWLSDFGVVAEVTHAPLGAKIGDWPGLWYELSDLPSVIDLLIIDGPPWSIHPFVRGAADCLFGRLSDGAVILLDDAARPGERFVAAKWKKKWPQIAFTRLSGGTKGTLHGRKRTGKVLAFPEKQMVAGRAWQKAAAAAILLALGWGGREVTEGLFGPAEAASFIDEANASYTTSKVRLAMRSQLESKSFDRDEILRSTGLKLPSVPPSWHVLDVQVFPSYLGNSVSIFLATDKGEEIVLYAQRAETPAELSPLFEKRGRRTLAYWEEGPFAYALTAELTPERVLALAARIAADRSTPS